MTVVTSIFFIIFQIFNANAQSEPSIKACENDHKVYCKDTEKLSEILICLKENHSKLSVECRQRIERGIKENIQTKPPTGMLFSGGGGLGGRMGFLPLIRYQGESFRKFKKNNNEDKVSRHSIEGSTPITKWKGGLISTSLRYGVTQFDEELRLNSGVRVKDKLEQLEFGLNYNLPLEGKKNFNIQGRYGYRGERIGGSEYNYSLMTGYSYPTESKKGRWQYFLMFSNNGPLGNNVPIPGIMYFYRNETMNLLLGLPVLSFQWNPKDTLWGLSLATFGPFYNFELFYGLADEVQFFGFTQWKQENFILNNRVEDEERLNLYEKVSGVGFRTVLLGGSVGLEGRAGFANDRKLYLGDGLFNKDSGSLDLKDSKFIRFMISKAFR